MYQVGKRQKQKSKKRRAMFWLAVILFLALLVFGFFYIRSKLKPNVVIKQAAPVVTNVNPSTQTKQYVEPDFTISLPATWVQDPAPAGPYQAYVWQDGDTADNGQIIEIYENVIPPNFAVNRELVVEGEVSHLTLDGTASDNCSNFTKNASTAGYTGAPAKWLGVDFLCDQQNTERDLIGTSSTDGINTVILTTSTGVSHKFLFTYTDHSLNPDYTIFYNALQSLHMN